MGRDDARLLLKAVCGIATIFAATVFVGQHTDPHGSAAVWWNSQYARHLFSRKNAAAEIQAFGALITFYGLLRAYLRATYDQTVTERIATWITQVWGRLLKLPQTIIVSTIPSTSRVGRPGIVQTPPPHQVDITLSLSEQIAQLAQYVNDRTNEASQMAINTTKLELDIHGVKEEMMDLERKLKVHMDTQIQAFDRNLDSRQALDLTWAIWGLLISFVGTAWGFGT